MNNNETQLLNSVLAIAALSANISPEELKEYVNALLFVLLAVYSTLMLLPDTTVPE